MDPNATLAEIRALTTEMTEMIDAICYDDAIIDVAEELVEKVTALDSWIRSGGFLPTAWAHTAGGA